MPGVRDKIVLPDRPFLYTVDQIASLINVEERTVLQSYLYFEGRSTGSIPRDQMRAVNIAPAGEKPDWRVAERVFREWMRFKGFKYYERNYYK